MLKFEREGNQRSPFFLILIFLFIGICLLSGAQYFFYLDSLSENNEKHTNLMQLKQDITDLKKINDEYAYDSLKKLLTQKDVDLLTTSLWKYELFCNGFPIQSELFTVSSSSIEIVLRETKIKTSLPDILANQGRITRGDEEDNVKNYLSVSKGTYYFQTSKDETVYEYIFEASLENKGDTLSIKISDQLLDELNLKNKDVRIVRNK